MTQYTPVLHLPYPEESDPPRGWEQDQARAEAIESAFVPGFRPLSEFVSSTTAGITLASAFASVEGSRLIFAGSVRSSSGSKIKTATVMFTLKPDYRPAISLFMAVAVAAQNKYSSAGRLGIGPDGKATYVGGEGVEVDSVWLSSAYTWLAAVPKPKGLTAEQSRAWDDLATYQVD
jgi:hypothetical protein